MSHDSFKIYSDFLVFFFYFYIIFYIFTLFQIKYKYISSLIILLGNASNIFMSFLCQV
jgi:hypothetical protein